MRVRIVVHGRVQGVGYRYFILQNAQKLNLTGWVKNQVDGTVLLEAQGDPTKIHNLIEQCKRGPMLAHVTSIDVNELTDLPNERNFEVRF